MSKINKTDLAFLLGMAYNLIPENHYKKLVTKHCIQCGKEHTHHNDFCSKSCCKDYKDGKPKHIGITISTGG